MKLSCSPLGPGSWRIGFASRADERAFALGQRLLGALRLHPPPGLREMVPAYTTLMLVFDEGTGLSPREVLAGVRAALERAPGTQAANPRRVIIPVVYGGPDLARVAAHAGVSEAEVVRLHQAPIYRVHMLGFAPGFAYLGGLDARLRTPRLDSPRPRVPAGAVALADLQTAVYPLETPGGWNLIGRTSLRMFDPSRPGEEAFRLRPGDEVRFVGEGGR